MGFTMARQLLLVLMTSSHLMVTSASIITFTKTPTTIKPILTKQLTLQCALEDSVPGGGLVGKRDGVTQTSTNIQRLISLVVQRNGQDIASITPFTAASAMGDQRGLNVTGDIATSTGHLHLTWSYPGESESGNMTCEANGIDSAGHNTVYSTSVVVGVQEPSLADLVNHVHDQEIKMVEQRTLIDQLMEDNKQQNLTNHEQSAKLDGQSKQLEGQSKLIDQQTKQLGEQNKQLGEQSKQLGEQSKQITHLLTKTGHVETGRVQCGDSFSWTSTGLGSSHGSIGITKAVTFKNKYSSPPIVHLSVVTMFTYHNTDWNGRDYWVDLVNVTETDFGIQCRNFNSDYHYGYYDFDVQWVSFPEYIA